MGVFKFFEGDNIQVIPVHLVDSNGIPLILNSNGTFSEGIFKQSDTFATAGSGVIITTPSPVKSFSLSVKPTGVVVSWTVVLEGSLDGENFTTILSHTNLVGANVCLFSGSNLFPCLYFRARCTALVLGLGTNIITTILGVR